MGRKAKDPALNLLAHELMDIKFTPNADLDSIANAFTPEDLRRVKISSNFKSYHVLYFIGGKYRIIGYTKNPTTACRFADMAEWRFWKYHMRDAHPPADSDLHFGVAQAKADCENETQAAALLSRIELYMREAAIIPDYKDLEAKRASKQKVKETRRTVRGDMYGLFADVFTALQDIKKALDVLVDRTQIPVVGGDPSLFKRDGITIDKVDFIVNVPHPDKKNEILKKVLIQIPQTERGTLTPEALDLIEQTKRDHLEQYKQKQIIDIFSEPTSTTNPTQI